MTTQQQQGGRKYQSYDWKCRNKNVIVTIYRITKYYYESMIKKNIPQITSSTKATISFNLTGWLLYSCSLSSGSEWAVCLRAIIIITIRPTIINSNICICFIYFTPTSSTTSTSRPTGCCSSSSPWENLIPIQVDCLGWIYSQNFVDANTGTEM